MPIASHADYYRILQVHPQAEQEVIEAAYRRLMRKYHPDMLDPNQRQDPEIRRRVREINEAYEVLGDRARRAKYDETLKNREHWRIDSEHLLPSKGSNELQSNVEKRLYPTRCSKTKQSFQILLARRKSSTGPFRVTGLVPLEESTQPKPVVPAKQSFFARLLNRIFRHRTTHQSKVKTNFPSAQELEAMFDESLVLDLGDIAWAGFKCPSCEGEYTHPDGTLSTWGVCGKCSHLYCAGGIRGTSAGGIVSCPWCGAKRQITHHVRTGIKSHSLVRGALTSSKVKKQTSDPLLHSQPESKQLPSHRGDKK